MILTNCAACAAPLAHDAPARCVGCRTRYCSDRCLRYHSHRGGHDEICHEIASGGGAEQYHAEKKYQEAVADAVEECAEDTEDDSASLDHLREAVTMYEDNARIARRVYGGAHPLVVDIEHGLRCARAALRARETPSSGDA